MIDDGLLVGAWPSQSEGGALEVNWLVKDKRKKKMHGPSGREGIERVRK